MRKLNLKFIYSHPLTIQNYYLYHFHAENTCNSCNSVNSGMDRVNSSFEMLLIAVKFAVERISD